MATSSIIVQKYGGTSVGSAERIKAVAERVVQTRKAHTRVVVVVSAMGAETDRLIRLAREVSPTPDPREYDALVSTGENQSAALLSMAIQNLGEKAISLTGPQAGILTKADYSRAKIHQVNPERIGNELNDGKIVIVTGFQGQNANNDVTTIGRGGSDTSAVALAAALGAKKCDIYTDVDGIYTTDPRRVKSARKIPEISYDEMLELASLGAKVLHPRSVECAKEHQIMIEVKSSFSDEPGTLVKEVSEMETTRPVTGVTVNDQEAKISILQVPDQPGVAGILFDALAEKNINVDMIVQSVEDNKINNISFTVHEDDVQNATTITEGVAQKVGASHVKARSEIAKLSIVGVGMMSKPGVAADMFKTLGDNGINIDLISTSEIKVSCVIDRKDADRALNLLHDVFNLHL